MRVKRRTAILVVAAVLVASLGAFAFVLLQPERLRGLVLDAVQGALSEGYEAELDAVEFDVGAGVARATGLRVFRTTPRREIVVSVPGLEAEVRPWEFLRHGRISVLRLKGPEVLLDIAADGSVSLAGILRPTGAPDPEGPAARPRVLVEGGRVRARIAGVLADGEEVRLRIEKADLQESRSGGVSTLEATLFEEGTAGRGGAGGLGRVALQGEVPFGRRGLLIEFERFTLDDALLGRLAPAHRETIASYGTVVGPFGEGPDAPGLEIRLSAAKTGVPGSKSPGTPPDAAIVLRPRGLRVVAKAFPIAIQDLRGDLGVTIPGEGGTNEAKVEVKRLSLRRPRGEIHVQVDGRFVGGAPTGTVRFWGRDIEFDRELHDAMPVEARDVWDAYNLGGMVDFTAAPRGTDGSFDSSVSRESPDAPTVVVARAQLIDGSLSYKGYPDENGVRHGFDFPVSHATGRLEFRKPVQGDAYEITLADLRGFTITGGPATAHGTITQWPEGRARVDVHVEAGEVHMNNTVRNGSPGMRETFAAWEPRGIAKTIHVHVQQDPVRDSTAGVTITMSLDGRAGFTWQELPVAIERIQGIVEVRDETVDGEPFKVYTVRGLRGMVGEDTPVSADGTVEGSTDPRLQITVDFKNLLLEGPLKEAAEKLGRGALLDVYRKMNPRGRVDLHAVVAGTDARRREVFEMALRGVDADGWEDIRWPTKGITGTVRVAPEEITLTGLAGQGEEGPVAISGKVLDPGGAAALDLLVRGDAVPLDERLGQRITPAAKRLEGFYGFVVPGKGFRGDAVVRLRGSGDAVETEVEMTNLSGPVAPLGLRGLVIQGGSARLVGTHVTLDGLEGAFEDRSFRIRTGSIDTEHGSGTFEAELRRLRFPQDLVPIISEENAATLLRLAPDRWIHAERLLVTMSDGFRTVRFDGPTVLSPPREGATGGLGLDGVFELRGLTIARGPNADDPSAVSGQIGITGGRFKAGVTVTEMEGTVDLSGVVGPHGNTVVASLSDVTARVNDWKLVRAGAEVSFPGDGVIVKDLRGILAGGTLDATIQTSDGNPSLDAKISLSRAQARALFATDDPKSEMEGFVDASVWFRNPTGKPEDMIGEGRMVLTDGKLFKVPLFAALYAAVDQADASPEFSGVRLKWDMKGDRLRFEEILLESSVLRLSKASGASYAWLDGRLDMKLNAAIELSGIERYPVFGWLVSGISTALGEVLERMIVIHAGGTLQNPDVGARGLPALFGNEPSDKLGFLPPPPAVTIEPRAPIRF